MASIAETDHEYIRQNKETAHTYPIITFFLMSPFAVSPYINVYTTKGNNINTKRFGSPNAKTGP